VILNDRVLIGFALSLEESYCTDLSLREFIALSPSLYFPVNSPRIFHGLKRIWEFLDERDLYPDGETDKYLDISKIEDTRLMAYLLNPDSSREVEHGDYRVQEELTLARVVQRYLGHDYPYRITDIYDRASLETAADILAHDAGLIFHLAHELPSVMSPDLQKLYSHTELPLMLVLDDMRRVGIGFDGRRCAEVMKDTERSMALLADEITGGQSVDLTSHEEVHDFLIKQGIQIQVPPAQLKRRGLKQPLEQIAHDYPVVRKILTWWDMGRDLGFLRRWAGHTRIHAVWGQTRSATSRIYARNPAVQNVSRELRHLFVPAPGHVLVKADYSQAQMRILAHLARDTELIRLFNDPDGDVHAETSELLGLNDRDVAKEINFAICFGMTHFALSRKINDLKKRQGSKDFIDGLTAWDYISGFHSRYPRIRFILDLEWGRLKSQPLDKRGVPSLIGRFRKFDRRATRRVERQFRVTWPQQIEADLIKTAMLRLDRIFRRRNMKARIVMMIHDAIWVEAPQEEESEVRRLVRRMMTTAGRLRVPLEVDIE